MPDYGRELTFGYFLIPNAADPLLDTAREIEARGLDWIGVQDHPYQRRFVDTWTLLGAIAAATARVGFFPDVANLPLRPPAVMAKAAASLDVLSGGRFELALGAGSFWEAVVAYGGPRREPRDALAALEEAIQVIRLMWSGERNLRFSGEHYRLAGAHSGPVPVHPIGIWLGVYGPRALRLAGRLADGWVPSLRGDLTLLSEGRLAWTMPRLRRTVIRLRSVAWSMSTVRSPMVPASACCAVRSTSGSMSSPTWPSATASTRSCSGATARTSFPASPRRSCRPYAPRSPPSAASLGSAGGQLQPIGRVAPGHAAGARGSRDETYVNVGSLRFAQVATCADRVKAHAELRVQRG